MATVTASDHRITTEQGSLFARAWVPSDVHRGADAPVLLFHDSLGCVELWRDFPESLAVATRRCVVAYDRLGFGWSDAHPGPLPLTFVRDEAVTVVPRVCEALGLDRMVPFGHSVGGAMAIATAARWPDRCVAVVTESAQSFVEENPDIGEVVIARAFARIDREIVRAVLLDDLAERREGLAGQRFDLDGLHVFPPSARWPKTRRRLMPPSG